MFVAVLETGVIYFLDARYANVEIIIKAANREILQ
jgi:hypothetical protein